MTEKTTCPACGSEVAIKKDGGLYKHPCDERRERTERAERNAIAAARAAQVSDPTPTVEETTTHLGNGVYGFLETHKGAEENCSGPDCGTIEGDDVSDKGPWFGAMYDGRCSVSECAIYEGDRIRADGQGGYECEDCEFDDVPVGAMYSEPTEEAVTDALPGPDWQAQASAAARRHVDAQASDTPYVTLLKSELDAQTFMDPRAVTYPGMDPAVRPTPITAEEFIDPANTEDVKPVMSVSGQPKKVRRDHQSRYAVVLPGEAELETYKSSGKPVGRTRVTTFIKQASSTIKLGEWKARNVVIGAARRRDLLLKAQGLTHEDDRDRLDAIVRELEETAGSKVGSDLGTYLHEFTEYMDAGLKTYHDAPEEFQRSLVLYRQALDKAGLEPIRSLIERTTIIREFGWVCGTFDRIFFHRPSGRYVIGDLKTAKTMDYGKNEVEAQLWCYAHGVNQNGIYDWNTDTWAFVQDMERRSQAEQGRAEFQVSESVGVVIHMPVQGPKEGTVELLWADLAAGAKHAELCHAVRTQPKGKMRPWGDGPAPAPRAVTSWELRFASVTSNEAATALWREAKENGVQGVFLNELIELAREAIRTHGVRG